MTVASQSNGAGGTAIVTVVTEDYLPFARSLLQMVADHKWGGERIAVLVDAATSRVGLPTGCESLQWDALLSRKERAGLRQRYTVNEICCSLKPVVMDHLLAIGFDRVHYLDSDIGVYRGLGELDASLRECSIQLTPHCFDDPPLDGRSPDPLTLMRAGVFNAGYVGVRSTTVGQSFLRWWAEKARRFGYVDPFAGMHGDQRWLDVVPARYPEVEILRDRGLNVGHWNLHERQLEFDGASYFVGHDPLVFFHFSGFDPETPGVLSEYQNRHSAAGRDALSRITDEYARLVIANGYTTGSSGQNTPDERNAFARLRRKLTRWVAPA